MNDSRFTWWDGLLLTMCLAWLLGLAIIVSSSSGGLISVLNNQAAGSWAQAIFTAGAFWAAIVPPRIARRRQLENIRRHALYLAADLVDAMRNLSKASENMMFHRKFWVEQRLNVDSPRIRKGFSTFPVQSTESVVAVSLFTTMDLCADECWGLFEDAQNGLGKDGVMPHIPHYMRVEVLTAETLLGELAQEFSMTVDEVRLLRRRPARRSYPAPGGLNPQHRPEA